MKITTGREPIVKVLSLLPDDLYYEVRFPHRADRSKEVMFLTRVEPKIEKKGLSFHLPEEASNRGVIIEDRREYHGVPDDTQETEEHDARTGIYTYKWVWFEVTL